MDRFVVLEGRLVVGVHEGPRLCFEAVKLVRQGVNEPSGFTRLTCAHLCFGPCR